jgi:Peptidase M50B-like
VSLLAVGGGADGWASGLRRLSPVVIRSAIAATGYRLAGHGVSRPALAAGALAVALLLVVPRSSWRWSRLAITAVHETGHALAALLVGRKVTAIHLRTDSSGVTLHYGPGGRVRRVVTAAAGYPAPGVLGLGGAWLLEHRQLRVWLVALLVLGVLNVVLWIRNLFGMVVMAGWIAGVGWLLVRGTAGICALVGAVAVWYFVLGGLRAALELAPSDGQNDAADIGRLVHLPSGLWKAFFVVVGGATLVGAGLLSVRAR